MTFTFTAPVFEWRGPAPYIFVAVPSDECDDIAEVARAVTYGWGMVPVSARIGATTFTTSLCPRNGGYVLPLKVAVQRAESISVGADVTVEMTVMEAGGQARRASAREIVGGCRPVRA